MKVRELNREQLKELKERWLIERSDESGEGVSYGELAEADELVDDETIFKAYGGTEFVPEDFSSPCGMDSLYEEEIQTGMMDRYFLVVDEWNYPTESGREPHPETYDTFKDAKRAAMETAREEEENYAEATNCDPLAAGWCPEGGCGDGGHAIVTAKNGLDEWFFASRVFEITKLPN